MRHFYLICVLLGLSSAQRFRRENQNENLSTSGYVMQLKDIYEAMIEKRRHDTTSLSVIDKIETEASSILNEFNETMYFATTLNDTKNCSKIVDKAYENLQSANQVEISSVEFFLAQLNMYNLGLYIKSALFVIRELHELVCNSALPNFDRKTCYYAMDIEKDKINYLKYTDSQLSHYINYINTDAKNKIKSTASEKMDQVLQKLQEEQCLFELL